MNTPDLGGPSKWRAALEIMRFDKPIGTFLLAAPTLWGIALANEGFPSLRLLAIFSAGIVVMRAAGCIANDLADRNLDGHVERTRLRPLVTGALSVKEAVALLLLLLATALGLVALTNPLTIKLSLAGAGLAMIYPLMKRITHVPQIVLGSAFSWSIPMAFAASINALPGTLWWLFTANLLWTVVYDTQYAMIDREDDLSVGIKSTAILSLAASMCGSSVYCSASASSLFGAVGWPSRWARSITLPLSPWASSLPGICG